MSKYRKEYYEKNKDKFRISHKKWADKNKDKIKEYYKRGRDKDKARRQNIYQDNKVKYDEKTRKYYQTHPWYGALQSAKKRCKKTQGYINRGIKCLLTTKEVKDLWFRDKAFELKKPSLDRKDGGKSYTYDNCRFIEHIANCRRIRTFVCPKCGHTYYSNQAYLT